MNTKRGPTKTPWQPTENWFWNHVDKDGPLIRGMESACWMYETRGKHGYGIVRAPTVADRKRFSMTVAHRVAWAFARGCIPDGVLVLHRCDNRGCCNPTHLFLGDDKANMDDMYQKKRGRKAHGSEQHLAKLTEEDVRTIRHERAKTPATPLKELAERFGVSLVAVSLVARGVTWKHVL